MKSDYSEDALIEQPAIKLFAELGWQTINAFHETFGAGGTLGREHAGEVVLRRHLMPALKKLNPKATADALDAALDELTRDRSVMSMGAANRDVYNLLKKEWR
jgi:type I restriction enzyme R subunit